MEFAKDLLDNLRGRVSAPPQDGPSDQIDWSALHARLGAAHAAVREMAQGSGCSGFIAGGFAEFNTVLATGGQSSMSVNRTDLADGKAAEGKDSAIAGTTMTGGRGQ